MKNPKRVSIWKWAALIALCVFAFQQCAEAQGTPPQKVNSNYQFKSVGADSGAIRIPKYATLPVNPSANYVDDGAIAFQASDSSIYQWHVLAHTWTKIGAGVLTAVGGGDTIISSNIELGGTLTHSPITHYNNFVPMISIPSPGAGDDGGQVWRVKSPSGGSKNSDFLFLAESINNGQGDTSHNEIMKWGWNTQRTIDPTKPEEHYAMEYQYNPFNNGRWMENHLELGTLDGAQTRLFSNTTVLTPDDQSIVSSQWDFRQSKYNFMDIQGNQCIMLQFNNGKSSIEHFWDQGNDNTSTTIGWTTDGSAYQINKGGGSSKALEMAGWTFINGGDASFAAIAGMSLDRPGVATTEGVIHTMNLLPNGNIADSCFIGTASNAYRGLFLKTAHIESAKFGDNKALAPDASAAIEIESITKGILFPRMTTVQKLAISSPAEGLQVYDLTLHQMSYYNGTTWVNF